MIGIMSEINTIDAKQQSVVLKLRLVEPNRSQPRKQFDEDALNELADSIKQYGILQPHKLNH